MQIDFVVSGRDIPFLVECKKVQVVAIWHVFCSSKSIRTSEILEKPRNFRKFIKRNSLAGKKGFQVAPPPMSLSLSEECVNMICVEIKTINHVSLILLLKYFNFLINAHIFLQLFPSSDIFLRFLWKKRNFSSFLEINLFIHMIQVKHNTA